MSFLRRLFDREPSKPSSKTRDAPPSACPYCGVVIDPPPARSRKCPDCRERIVVRTRRSDGAKVLLTEADAADFDEQRKAEAARNDAIRKSSNIGATPEDFANAERTVAQKFGTALPRDVFWQLANEFAVRAMKSNDWHALSMVYWQQARLLYEEGKPHLDLAREASKASLQRYAHDGFVKQVEILCNCCELCERDAGRKMSVQDAMEQLPIPHEESANDGWCICLWVPVVD